MVSSVHSLSARAMPWALITNEENARWSAEYEKWVICWEHPSSIGHAGTATVTVATMQYLASSEARTLSCTHLGYRLRRLSHWVYEDAQTASRRASDCVTAHRPLRSKSALTGSKLCCPQGSKLCAAVCRIS